MNNIRESLYIYGQLKNMGKDYINKFDIEKKNILLNTIINEGLLEKYLKVCFNCVITKVNYEIDNNNKNWDIRWEYQDKLMNMFDKEVNFLENKSAEFKEIVLNRKIVMPEFDKIIEKLKEEKIFLETRYNEEIKNSSEYKEALIKNENLFSEMQKKYNNVHVENEKLKRIEQKYSNLLLEHKNQIYIKKDEYIKNLTVYQDMKKPDEIKIVKDFENFNNLEEMYRKLNELNNTLLLENEILRKNIKDFNIEREKYKKEINIQYSVFINDFMEKTENLTSDVTELINFANYHKYKKYQNKGHLEKFEKHKNCDCCQKTKEENKFFNFPINFVVINFLRKYRLENILKYDPRNVSKEISVLIIKGLKLLCREYPNKSILWYRNYLAKKYGINQPMKLNRTHPGINERFYKTYLADYVCEEVYDISIFKRNDYKTILDDYYYDLDHEVGTRLRLYYDRGNNHDKEKVKYMDVEVSLKKFLQTKYNYNKTDFKNEDLTKLYEAEFKKEEFLEKPREFSRISNKQRFEQAEKLMNDAGFVVTKKDKNLRKTELLEKMKDNKNKK